MPATQFSIKTTRRTEMINVTSLVERWLSTVGAREGLCHLYVPHTTAAVTINEGADPDVAEDILDGLERLAPREGKYLHSEGNADAHIKATLVGASELIRVSSGRLALGTWQAVFFCEFDGPRSRRLAANFLGSTP